MTANRQRNAWVWLAMAAIAVAVLPRAQAGLPSAAAVRHPVLEFLSAHAGSGTFGTFAGRRNPDHSSARQSSSQWDRSISWPALLPIFFVGLIAPLSLISARTSRGPGRIPSAPPVPCLFQRPPPASV